jgi:hypothetical protein
MMEFRLSQEHAQASDEERFAISHGRANGGAAFALLAAGAAVVLSALILLHVRGMNGPWYWFWGWFVMPPEIWYPWMLVAALPLGLAGLIELWRARHAGHSASRRLGRAASIFMLGVAVIAMKFMAMTCVYPHFDPMRISAIVMDPHSTDYYTDAGAINSVYPDWSWLGTYKDWLPSTNMHTQSKPPGPVAFHMLFIRAFGYGSRGATVDGIALAVLAAPSVPAVYWLLLVLSGDAAVAMAGASMLALCPGFILIYPTLDAALVAPVAVLLATWHLALWRDGPRAWAWALLCGVVLAFTVFMAYTSLVVGLFMAGDLLLALFLRPASSSLPAQLIGRILLVFVGFGVVYLPLFVTTGFDPLSTFRAAWNLQHQVLGAIKRPYPWTILFDLTDFVFSAAWIILIPIALTIAYRLRAPRASAAIASSIVSSPRLLNWLLVLALAQPVVVAAAGLVQTETARVWNFMLPMLLLPAALEVARWRPWARGVFYASMLLLMLVIGQNMQFVQPVPRFGR